MTLKKEKLGKLCDITSSKRIFYAEYVESGVPFYRSKEIIERESGQDISESLYISETKYESIKSKFGTPSTSDMLLTSVGTIGIPYIVKDTDRFYFKDGNLTWFRNFNKELYSKFLYYWIKSPEGQATLYNLAIGSSQKALTIAMLKEISIPLPLYAVQQKIADILSAYDDLIENNQKQIKLLEEAAQRLYKEWFVDFRFPGHEQAKFIDGLPEGWIVKQLSEIATVVMGQSPKSEFYNAEKKGIAFHQGVGSYGVRFAVDNIYTTSFNRVAEAGDILFSVRAPVGRINITKNRVAIGRGIAALRHKLNCQSYLYYALCERFFKDNLIGNGSIFASISKEDLLAQHFNIPPMTLLKKFNDMVKVIDDKIEILDSQLSILQEARDMLLPKLMSGEIAV